MEAVDIVIIGAGISGLIAATEIRGHSGVRVQMIEQEPAPGGRFATQVVHGAVFDQGAQFITARSASFRDIVNLWLSEEWITPWYGENNPRYAAAGGMSQLAARLAHPHEVQYGAVVDSITPAEIGYCVRTTDNLTGTSREWLTKSVLLTFPVPQAFPLLEAGQIPIESGARAILEQVMYMPALALSVGVDENGKLSEGYLREPFPGIISWIADNRHKGISEVPAWTIHLDSDWSSVHFVDTDEEVWRQVLPYLRELLGGEAECAMLCPIQRWRYAKAHSLIQAPYLDIGSKAPLVLTGDAFDASSHSSSTGSRVENAVLSGIEAGRYLIEKLLDSNGRVQI